MFGSCLSCCMNKSCFLFVALYLFVTTSPATPAFHSINFPVSNFLGVSFVRPKAVPVVKYSLP